MSIAIDMPTWLVVVLVVAWIVGKFVDGAVTAMRQEKRRG